MAPLLPPRRGGPHHAEIGLRQGALHIGKMDHLLVVNIPVLVVIPEQIDRREIITRSLIRAGEGQQPPGLAQLGKGNIVPCRLQDVFPGQGTTNVNDSGFAENKIDRIPPVAKSIPPEASLSMLKAGHPRLYVKLPPNMIRSSAASKLLTVS